MAEAAGPEPASSAEHRLDQYHQRRQQALRLGADARQWLLGLLDPGSFVEIDLFAGLDRSEAVVAGWGTIGGREVAAYAFEARHRTLGEAASEKVAKLQGLALRSGIPIIGAWEPGEPAADGLGALGGMARVLNGSVGCSGVVPRLSVVLGPRTGPLPLSELADFIFAVGADSAADFVAADDRECCEQVRRLVPLLPSRCGQGPVRILPEDDPERSDPGLQELGGAAYDAHQVARRVLDDGWLLEVQPHHAPNLVVGFGRLDGWTVGVVANQPRVRDGVIDADAALKGARFVRFCDAFDIPLLTLINAPGGVEESACQEVARLVFAYAEATTPMLAVATGPARQAAYWAMAPRQLGTDSSLAWPWAEIGAGAEGHDPYAAAERGYLDAVIEPRDTRRELVGALRVCLRKRVPPSPRKHATLPR